MRTHRYVVPPLLLALAATGCSHRSTSSAGPGGGDRSLLTPYGAALPTGSAGGDDRARSSADGDGAVSSAAGSARTFVGRGAPRPADPVPLPGTAALRAGFVDDNAHFSDYLAFLKQMDQAGVHGDPLDVSDRHVVTVVDHDGKPVLAATVALLAGDRVLQTARTHADGRALLFPAVAGGGDIVQVTLGHETHRQALGTEPLRVQLDQVRPVEPVRLDLHFLLDTTGSMGDEIDRLRSTLDQVAQQIDALPQKPQVRYGLTVYRDHGDAYVSLTHDFTDLATFRKELGRTVADGGGDTPEALDEAFHGAVNGPAWDSDHAVQIAFLVADASPHLDDGPGGPSYAKDVLVAQQKGIEVVPLAASGTDDPAELVFRQLAEYSMGTFFFLTYGPHGGPGDGTDRHVSGYGTGSLEDLVVGHVASRLAALDGKAAGQ
ncbi:MAG: vWA domain-containing protein [Mycobacteriales bacterium]